MSWQDIVKQDGEKEEQRETLRRLGFNEITDALSIVKGLLKARYDIALDKVRKYLEDYLKRTEELQ